MSITLKVFSLNSQQILGVYIKCQLCYSIRLWHFVYLLTLELCILVWVSRLKNACSCAQWNVIFSHFLDLFWLTFCSFLFTFWSIWVTFCVFLPLFEPVIFSQKLKAWKTFHCAGSSLWIYFAFVFMFGYALCLSWREMCVLWLKSTPQKCGFIAQLNSVQVEIQTCMLYTFQYSQYIWT